MSLERSGIEFLERYREFRWGSMQELCNFTIALAICNIQSEDLTNLFRFFYTTGTMPNVSERCQKAQTDGHYAKRVQHFATTAEAPNCFDAKAAGGTATQQEDELIV